jgi:hypothetical protein
LQSPLVPLIERYPADVSPQLVSFPSWLPILVVNTCGFGTTVPRTLATATVDRLLHHAPIVLTTGASYRFTKDLDAPRGTLAGG